MNKILKIAKIAGLGIIAYELLSYKAVRSFVKTALLAKGTLLIKDKLAK